MKVGQLVQEIATGEIGLVVDDPELLTTFQQVIAGDLHKYWLAVLWTDGKTRLIRRERIKELT
jgi:hypothetical protein